LRIRFTCASRIVSPASAAAKQYERFGGSLRRNDLHRAANCFFHGVTVNLLRRAVPQNDAAIEIAAGDRNRRCVDNGRERILGLLHFVLPPCERNRHAVEGVSKLSDFIAGAYRSAMSERACREHGCVFFKLLERAHDCA
jgi:hypothetical protein